MDIGMLFLGRHIAVKPIIEDAYGQRLEICPVCTMVLFHIEDRCPGCGQLIDWKGADNEV
jgi:predicted amidophosphoribosyltransferase